MGKKLKKMVMKRKGLCDFVVSAAMVQGPEIGGSLGEFLSPVLGEGETLPDLELPITLLGRKLSLYGDAMVEADQGYFAAVAELAEVQKSAEAPSSQLKGKVLSLRSTCQGLFGEPSVQALALDFNVVPDRDAAGMLRQGEIIRDRLRSVSREFVSERWVNSPLDREAAAQEFEPEIAELRQAVALIVEHRKKVDTAKVRKDQTLEAFDRQFIRITRVLEAYFRVVGEVELADRIRPTVRQLGRDSGEEEKASSREDSESPEIAADAPSEPANSETQETAAA